MFFSEIFEKFHSTSSAPQQQRSHLKKNALETRKIIISAHISDEMTTVRTTRNFSFFTQSSNGLISKKFSIKIETDETISTRHILVDEKDFNKSIKQLTTLISTHFREKGNIILVDKKKSQARKPNQEIIRYRAQDLDNIQQLFQSPQND